MKELEVHSKKIILASKSPRRKYLLEAAGFDLKVYSPNIDETYPKGIPDEQIAMYLAEKKAEAARPEMSEGDIVIAADSIVLLDAQILGKPKDIEHCKAMLADLSDKVHKVITGVCMLNERRKEIFDDLTEVKFAGLSDAEILYYVDRFRPLDKAGSYAIQEWIGHCKIEWIKGSYTNVMGLPLQKVYQILATVF
jgi:septum formation protein